MFAKLIGNLQLTKQVSQYIKQTMIKNLLLAATTSFDLNQRKYSQQVLNNEFLLRPFQVSNELFNMMCSLDKTEHILGYTFIKKIIQQSQKEKLIDFNSQMQKAFSFWYHTDLNRNTLNQQFNLQKQNIINLHALFLSLHSSMKYRQDFMDVIPFKICELCSKNDKNQLQFFLSFYGQVLKQLDKYRIGNINSKRAAMGSVMLLKVTTKLHPSNSLQASLWVDFSINFSKFNRWVPDRNFLITCLSDFHLNKGSFMSLLQFFSVNIRQTWTLEDYAKLMACLQREMEIISLNMKKYECKEVQTLLKCVKSLLYNFFTCDKQPTNQIQANIVDRFRSFEDFDRISSFVMNVIDYFSKNNQNEVCGNLSQMIIEYSTQVLRLYVNYLDEQLLEDYAKQFIGKFNNRQSYEKILVLLSSMPKFILSIFQYENITAQLLSHNMPLHESFEPVYVNYLTHIVDVSEYMDYSLIQNIGKFLFSLIKNRQPIINLQNGELFGNNLSQETVKNVERMSLALYGLSKLTKYKEITDKNGGYFQIMYENIFVLLQVASNDFSLLIDCLNELIKQQNPQWNYFICTKCMYMLESIYSKSLREQRVEFYQLEIELYRVINKTFSLVRVLDSIQQLITETNFNGNIDIHQFSQLKILVYVCNLEHKSAPVKEEIILLTENILITINQVKSQGKFLLVYSLITELLHLITNKFLFQEIYKTLYETEQFIPQQSTQTNLFSKVSIDSEQYAIVDYGPSKQLHLSCIKILLQSLLYEENLETIFNIISRLQSQYLLCVWQALQIIYPGKIPPHLIPPRVQQRLQKIRTGHILDLFQSMGLNEQSKYKPKSTPSWYQLYRNILRQDSVVIDIIHQKVKQQQ